MLIRLRQEMRKHLDATRQTRLDFSPREYRGLFRKEGPPQTLADSPLASHLLALDRNTVPNLDTIRAEAQRARSGEWSLFGHPVRMSAKDFQWCAHPLSGHIVPLHPWNRLRYLNGEYGGDVKFIWELNRHKALLRLAQEWFATREDATAAALAGFLDGWMAENPPGRGINWASSLEVGFRGIAWCWIAALTALAPIWSEERRRRFHWFLWHHARHIERYDSIHHSPNTHLTGEALGLVYIGSCFPQFRQAERWRRFGLAILGEETRRQVLPDGMHFERSTGYHRYTVEILLHAIALSRLTGRARETAELEKAAEKATEVLAGLRRPDGTVPVLGDEDGGSAVPLSTADPRDVSPLLVVAAGLFSRAEWLRNLKDDSRDLAYWVLSPDAFRGIPLAPKCPPLEASLSLPASGYFAAWETSEVDPWFCLVDGGPHGGDATGHAHDDIAHMEVSTGNLLLSADPGSSSYTGDLDRREWERSAAAHGTLLLESRNLAEARGSFAWGLLPPSPRTHSVDAGAYWACQVTRRLGHGGQDPVHERQAVLLRGYGVLVCDWLHGAEGQPIRVTWPIAHDMGALQLEGTNLRVADRASIQWYWSGLMTPSAVLAPHRFAPSYGETLDGAALLLRGIAQGSGVIVTVFADGTAIPPAFRWSGSSLAVALPHAVLSFTAGQLPELALPPALTG